MGACTLAAVLVFCVAPGSGQLQRQPLHGQREEPAVDWLARATQLQQSGAPAADCLAALDKALAVDPLHAVAHRSPLPPALQPAARQPVVALHVLSPPCALNARLAASGAGFSRRWGPT